MNVIIANEQLNQLSNLDIDVIKSLNGTYSANEIVDMFSNFFFSKMIIDVTAIKDYADFRTYEIIKNGLEVDKLIFLLPEDTPLCTADFLARLINIGIYNFTSNVKGVIYLLKKTNSLKDVEGILKMANIKSASDVGAVSVSVSTEPEKEVEANRQTIIGFKNVTKSAGSTTFVYMLLKELSNLFGKDNVIAIEIGKNDFSFFNDKSMVSAHDDNYKQALSKFSDKNVVLVDLNDCDDTSFCTDVYYLIEPSTIMLNRLVRKDRNIFSKLSDKKVILNKSLLLNSDVFDFEREAGIRFFYNFPPLDERKNNSIFSDFLAQIGVINYNKKNNSSKIFGLFRR